MRITRLAAFESAVEPGKIAFDRTFGKMIHHVSFSSGSGTFHLLPCLAVIKGYHFPFSGGSFPFQFVFPDMGSQIDAPPVSVIGHHAAQYRIRLLFLVSYIDVLYDFLASFYLIRLEDSFAGCLFDADFRSSKGPSCSGIHVDLDAGALSFRLCMFEHFHPSGRKKLNIVGVIALHSINGSDFYGAHAGTGVFFEIVSQVLLVDSASQPPPSGTGAGFCRSIRPLLCLYTSACCEHAEEYQLFFIHYSVGV